MAAPATGLAPFPPAPAWPFPRLAALSARGVGVRPLSLDDAPWLRTLYASTREDELAPVGWPEAQRRAFLDQQFDAQHRDFVARFNDAAFLAIETTEGTPLGRVILRRPVGEDTHVIDVALLPAARGRGLGSLLFEGIQRDAMHRNVGVRLHVLRSNSGAQRLYARLGFRATGEDGAYRAMAWRAGALN